jgi:hypothetical protein
MLGPKEKPGSFSGRALVLASARISKVAVLDIPAATLE